ncbi:MAG TPA: hypothetical protein VE842_06565 [Pyrinomonadaceae bacterium]|nr:hypothetical protein [Pyrinomonadaceae bacterium]
MARPGSLDAAGPAGHSAPRQLVRARPKNRNGRWARVAGDGPGSRAGHFVDGIKGALLDSAAKLLPI